MGNALNVLLFPAVDDDYAIEHLKSGVVFVPECFADYTDIRDIPVPFPSDRKGEEYVVLKVTPADSTSANGDDAGDQVGLNIQNQNRVILYLHGNGCNVLDMCQETEIVAAYTQSHIVSMEYPGYGVCRVARPTVAATPELVDRWVLATVNFLLWLEVPPESLIIFGRSIGSGPAAKIARVLVDRGLKIGGLILQSPFESIHKLVSEYAGVVATLLFENWWDTAAELTVLEKAEIPLMIMHGMKDNIVPFSHGYGLFQNYKVPVKTLKLGIFTEDGDHNGYQPTNDVAMPLVQFLVEIVAIKAPLYDEFVMYIPRGFTEPPLHYRRGPPMMKRSLSASSARSIEQRIMPVQDRPPPTSADADEASKDSIKSDKQTIKEGGEAPEPPPSSTLKLRAEADHGKVDEEAAGDIAPSVRMQSAYEADTHTNPVALPGRIFSFCGCPMLVPESDDSDQPTPSPSPPIK